VSDTSTPGRAWRRRLDPRRLDGGTAAALATLLAVVAALWLFAALTDEVLEGETRAFDESLLLALRAPGDPGDPLGPPWLEAAVADLTALGGYAVLVTVAAIAAGYLLVVRRRATALLVPLLVAAGALANQALKSGLARPRPELVSHLVEVHSMSYPSGHAMLAAIVYLSLGVLLAEAQATRRARAYVVAAALLLTLLVGASRVYLGVHWPTDVLAGWAAGAAVALAVWLVLRRGPRRAGRRHDEA